MTTTATDRDQIVALVNDWVVHRDAGDWARFAEVWHVDGWMNATWMQGPASDFIAASRKGMESGVQIMHMLGGVSVEIRGDRAIAQSKMVIHQRGEVHGVACDVECYGRFYDFIERRDCRWAIVNRQPIYERDRLIGLVPAQDVRLDTDLLEEFPHGYRHLAYLQVQQGMTVEREMPGLVGPAVEALYARGRRWLDSNGPAR